MKSDAITEAKCHEIHVLLINGSQLNFTLREMREFAYSRNVLILLAVVLLLLAACNPTLFPTLPTFTSRVFYWAVGVLLYLLVVPAWVKHFYALWSRFVGRLLPAVIGTAPLVFGLTWFTSEMPSIFGDWLPERGHSITWFTYLKNWFIANVIETIALVWLLPLYRMNSEADASQGEPEDKTEDTKFVVLSGRYIPVDTILNVRSSEHYLIVTTLLGTTEYRARMKDFLKQVSGEDGIQTHRSHWVSTREIQELYGSVVKTRSGTDIPVSRGRMSDVKEWFRRQARQH